MIRCRIGKAGKSLTYPHLGILLMKNQDLEEAKSPESLLVNGGGRI